MLPRYVGILLVVGLLLVGGVTQAADHKQVPVVDEDAISTPTPTWILSLLPTPTSTPDLRAVDSPHPSDSRISGYTVRAGDSAATVAIELGIDLLDVPCAVAPDFSLRDPLVVGDVLFAPPPGYACYEVQLNETLVSIANDFGLATEQLRNVGWNSIPADLADITSLVPGIHLRIPLGGSQSLDDPGYLEYMLEQPVDSSPFVGYAVGGPGGRTTASAAIPPDWPFGSGQFSWPVYGWLSQGYRYDHRAIDIAAPLGTFVTSSDRGVVTRAGWNDQGYGYFVVIDHNIDYVTVYAHLHEVRVAPGEVVAAGTVIGTVGSSGNSSGPHLHFEIRDFGRRANPLELISR